MGAVTGEPALLRRRSLLFSADSMGCPEGPEAGRTGGDPVCSGCTLESACDVPLYVLIVVRGLKVTVRRSRSARGDVFALGRWYCGSNGEVSVVVIAAMSLSL